MRIMFASTPAFGHLLPMLPLAAAARRAGHEVALLTHPSMAAVAAPLRILPAGPTVPEGLADVWQHAAMDPMAERHAGAVQFFVESRLRLGAEQALAAARDFRPDLVVADVVDYLAQLGAATLGVPWVAQGASLPMETAHTGPLAAAAAARFRDYGAVLPAPVAYVDPWPESLQRPVNIPPAPRIPLRPEPHAGNGEPWSPPGFPGREDRPLVLVTMGTIVEDPGVLAAILGSLARLDVNVLAAPHAAADLTEVDLAGAGADLTRVHLAGFVPMKDLLRGVDVVVSVAGAGTVLSALSVGLPMVLLPMGLDKPVNAERVAAAGAAQVVAAPEEIAGAVEKVLTDPSFAAGAQVVAAEIAAMNSADEAFGLLLATAGA